MRHLILLKYLYSFLFSSTERTNLFTKYRKSAHFEKNRSHANGPMQALRTPNYAYFYWNPELLSLGRQIGHINSGAFGVFLAELWALGAMSPLFMLSITPTKKPKYPHPKYSFGIGIWIRDAKNLEFNIWVSSRVLSVCEIRYQLLFPRSKVWKFAHLNRISDYMIQDMTEK